MIRFKLKLPVLLLMLTSVLMLAAGGFTYQHLNPASTAQSAEAKLLATPFLDLDQRPQSIKQWSNQTLVINFWATWCGPCREEIPEFIALQKHYQNQVQFVGIAIDERDKVSAYRQQFGINYPLLLGSTEALNLMKELGNPYGILPFTVVIDRQGKQVNTTVGRMTKTNLASILIKLITK